MPIIVLFSGCYDDKGNYTYDEIGEILISLPEDKTSYDVPLGGLLKINSSVVSDVDNNNLTCVWEIYSNDAFRKFAEGESLECEFGPSEYVPSAGIYTIRLTVTRKDNQVQVFSKHITVHVTGNSTGLMVLHGYADSCDIAIVRASEFLGMAPDIPLDIQVFRNWYSDVNGVHIQGKAISVIHSYTSDTDPDRCYVVALTTEGGICADYETGHLKMLYKDLFFGGLNQNMPEGFFALDTKEVVFDGGDVFSNAPSEAAWGSGSLFFSTPLVPVKKNYSFAPFLFTVDGWNYGADAVLFDRNSHAFIQIQGFWGGEVISSAIKTPGSKFDLSDMQAELVYMDRGGSSGHHVAIMKSIIDEQLVAVELDFAADVPDNIPYAKYDLNQLEAISTAKFFAFGDNNPSMCYYANGTSIYRYILLSDNAQPTSSLLTTSDGRTPVTFDGRVTMMKILKPNEVWGKFSYYMYNKILVVGTQAGEEGILYAFELDDNGNVKSQICKIDGFKTITDVAIKGL